VSDAVQRIPEHLDDAPTWLIDECDIFGRARLAHCGSCGFEWTRPDVDHEAETLPLAAATHNRTRHGEGAATWTLTSKGRAARQAAQRRASS
jgi:hypothetical protein